MLELETKKLLIVESPAKAKTISKYLGSDFYVMASVGHIRDLPKASNAIKITEKAQGQWDFVPKYVISDEKKKVVAELRSLVKISSAVYLASDPDREGEAIAWHLQEVLRPLAEEIPFYRVSYNEITKDAVLRAVASPHDIDMPLVNAQQARRILDRLVGYEVSRLLWHNIACPQSRSLSAGRVQSVALRLLVERQREIDAFVPTTYYLLGVEARRSAEEQSFVAKLARIDGEKPKVESKDLASSLLLDLSTAKLKVIDVRAQAKVRHVLPPFTTSTLQQAASSVLGFSPGRTMKLAQELYEKGHITYMRTDSVNISEQARNAAKEFIISNFGSSYYPASPHIFRSKADAQGAHEAIRPTNILLTPKEAEMEPSALKLYDLIWRRFLASQMADAQTTVKTIFLEAEKESMIHQYVFTATATQIDFDGFLKVMKLSLKRKDETEKEDDDDDEVAYLPNVGIGDCLEVVRWLSDEKQTKGPSHYSEASLIKALEENGVGRPSTYAATIETLKQRNYAKTEKKKLIPLERGILVCNWLVAKLDSLFNVGYTALMEAELDKIEAQGEPMNQMLSEFYAKFLKAIEECIEPPPNQSNFDFIFGLLDQIKEWKPPRKVGKRVYDDRKFFESIKEQSKDSDHPLSNRQLEYLVKLAMQYESQIPDCAEKIQDARLDVHTFSVARADPKIVKYCFEQVDRIEGLSTNKFVASLREQDANGQALTAKQLTELARVVGESVGQLPDGEEIRARLSEFVPDGFRVMGDESGVPEMMKMLEGVSKWRTPVKRGRKAYDDQKFFKSLMAQFDQRHVLSPRQHAALKRLIRIYREQIPNYKERAEALGLEKSNGDSAK